MKNLIAVICLIISWTVQGQNITGEWNGVLKVQGMELRLVLHVSEEEGAYSSKMDSPDQGVSGIPMDATSFEEGTYTISAKSMGMTYSANLNETGTELDGTFKQGGMTLPLKMTREKIAKTIITRPQEPKEFPYKQEEVKFVNPKGGHHLAGTLTMPNDGKFNQAVVLVSGSGPQDRNEELLNHKPFLVLSDHFTRQGIAVLRFDDRGVAESEGDFSSATTRDFADDASAAIAFLKSRQDMEGKKLGIAGHSEGGMIAPVVASENQAVDFIVLLAGPGIDSKTLLLKQIDLISAAEGMPVEERKLNNAISEKAFDFIIENPSLDKEELTIGLRKILEEGFDQFPQEMKDEIGSKEEFFKGQEKMMTSDWFVYFMRFDPSEYLTKVQCPILAVNGSLDLQVPAIENLEGIKKETSKAGNKNVTIRNFEGLNHLFQKTETGATSEYAELEETFNVEVMNFVSDWVLEIE